MKKLGWIVCFMFVVSFLQAGETLPIIPKPKKIEVLKGNFQFTDQLVVVYQQGELKATANYLAKHLSLTESSVNEGATAPDLGLFLTLNGDKQSQLGTEGYLLKVENSGIEIKAATQSGLFYGIQTLFQLLSPALVETTTDLFSFSFKSGSTIPCLKIMDAPSFEWRGFMLDSCRHYQTVNQIKRYLDLMAFYKMNQFHWHLTEDEAWRIQIDAYPLLTEIGSKPREGTPEVNGYYTKEDIKEIIAYAKSRYISVIPEIDIPGHASAALYSYPQYSCKEGPFDKRDTGLASFVGSEGRLAFCAGNPETMVFLKTILDEVMDLFESPIIHIGGDERPKGNWDECDKCQAKIKALGLRDDDQLQNWMMDELNQYILKNKNQSICWAENMSDGIPKNQIVQAWHPGEALYAAKAGHQVINSDNGYTYLDYPSHIGQKESHPDWMPVMTLRKTYQFKPVPRGLRHKYRKNIIGVEAPIWTETVTIDRLDFKVFPRLIATAEVGWSTKKNRKYRDFLVRLNQHSALMQAIGIEYDKSIPDLK